MDVAERLARRLGQCLEPQGLSLVLAESCTGGWLAKVVSAVPGCSAWFDRGFVAYSNAAKCEMLGVAPADIERHGAVSEVVVRAMASGALRASRADLAIAISGVSGPGGGTPEKPVGTVWMAFAHRGGEQRTRISRFAGARDRVRQQAVLAGLQGALELGEALVAARAGGPPGTRAG